MPRKVIFRDKRPKILEPKKDSLAICMCGLSRNRPFCDGSHHLTQEEDDDKMYDYDENNESVEIG